MKTLDWSNLSKLETTEGGYRLLFACPYAKDDCRIRIIYEDENGFSRPGLVNPDGKLSDGITQVIREKVKGVQKWAFHYGINGNTAVYSDLASAENSRSFERSNGVKCSQIFYLKGELTL